MLRNPLQRNATLGDWLRENANSPNWILWGAQASVSLDALATGSALGGRRAELAGRSVFVATADQLAAAVALIELDGVARRLILCPPDLPAEHIPLVAATAAVDAVVSDRAA